MRILDRIQIKRLKTVTIIILAIALLISLQSGAQGPTVTSGFGFIRKPRIPDHIIQGAREGIVHEIYRLTMLATIPLNTTDVTDYVGNPIVWDQPQLDAVNAKITELQTLLAQF